MDYLLAYDDICAHKHFRADNMNDAANLSSHKHQRQMKWDKNLEKNFKNKSKKFAGGSELTSFQRKKSIKNI